MHKLYTVLLAVVFALGVSRTPCRSQEIYLSLERALELCLQVHPELQAAQQHIQEARAAAWYTWSPENPSLSVEYEGVPKGGGVEAAGARKLKVSQQLAFPTNMIAAGKAASLVIRQKQYEYDAVALEIISRVKTAYWQLAAEQRHYRLATQNAALADDFLEKARRRYEVGEAAKLEYIKARVEKARAENTLTRTKNTVHVVRAHLNTLLMREADAPVVLTDSLEYIPFPIERDALTKSALELHPLLARARVASRRAKTDRTLAWGSFLPNLELKYFEHTIEGASDFWGGEIGISVPLWFPFKQRGAIQRASAAFRRREFEYASLRNEIILRIETAFTDAAKSEQQVQLYRRELLAEAEEVYRIAERSYSEGESSYLELLDAQRTLIQVRSEYIHHLLDYFTALIRLERAVGQRLSNEE